MFNHLKWKLWFRRHSISSPRIQIRTPLPWPIRLLFIATVVGLSGAIATFMVESIRRPAAHDTGDAIERLTKYKEEAERLAEEHDRNTTTVNAAESQINIERSALKQLAAQVKTLEEDNTRLKEDLAFFESLLPNATGPQGISIRRLKIDSMGSNQIRYRLLIMQGGSGINHFTGTLQLAVTTMLHGKSAMIIFPESNSVEAEKFKLGFKHYQRVEGVLTLPEGVAVKTVQARVLEKGQIRAQQSANL
jgi:hypothetical protein